MEDNNLENNNLQKKYVCQYCGRICKNKSAYTLHINVKHLKITKINIKYELCPICNKQIKYCIIDKHKEKCLQKQIENNKHYNCEKCGKLVTKKFGSGRFCSRSCANGHIQTEEQNKKRSITLKKYAKSAKFNKIWNTNNRINYHKTIVMKHKEDYYKNPNYCKFCGKIISFEDRYKKCCSIECRSKIVGGYRRSKIFLYKGIKLQSSYELTVAKELDKNNIKWTRPKYFIYKTDKLRKYTPDFYLPDYDVYLDPKNDFLANSINFHTKINDLEKLKIVEKQNNIMIIPLLKNQLDWNVIKGLVAQKKSARLTSERS